MAERVSAGVTEVFVPHFARENSTQKDTTVLRCTTVRGAPCADDGPRRALRQQRSVSSSDYLTTLFVSVDPTGMGAGVPRYGPPLDSNTCPPPCIILSL